MSDFYEIHVTVKHADRDYFVTTCRNLNVKPILLSLQNKDGVHMVDDVMTSSTIKGSLSDCENELNRISSGLKSAGLDVVREKVETWPFHELVPNKENNLSIPRGCYFESHVNILCCDELMPELASICKKYNFHLSRNIFKDLGNGNYNIMATYRDYNSKLEDFQEYLNTAVSEIKSRFTVEKLIVEYAIKDSNYTHDDVWIN